jgi:hypothetical protein
MALQHAASLGADSDINCKLEAGLPSCIGDVPKRAGCVLILSFQYLLLIKPTGELGGHAR